MLGIHGSPRRAGNSEILLAEALDAAAGHGADVELLRAAELKVAGCLGCGGCDRTGECVVQDAMQTVYPKLDAAEAIILASPVYFYGFPAQLKTVLDRAQARWARRRLEKTPQQRQQHDRGRGYLIAVGASRGKKLFEGLRLTARFFFDALDMSYADDLLLPGIDARGAVRQRATALEAARELGRRAASRRAPAHPT